MLRSLVPSPPEVAGLLALMLYQRSRFAARVSAAGELVLLEDQDRSRWDLSLIHEANAVLAATFDSAPAGTYQLQAAIASVHANARSAADTDWSAIASGYSQLVLLTGSPVVRLNHAVAVAMADGPLAGLALVDTISGLDNYHLLYATRADLLERAGDPAGAAASYALALQYVVSPAERRHLDRRLAAVSATP